MYMKKNMKYYKKAGKFICQSHCNDRTANFLLIIIVEEPIIGIDISQHQYILHSIKLIQFTL